MKFKKNLYIKLLVLFTLVLFVSCSSTKEMKDRSVDDYYKDAIEKFNKKDWLEAQTLFDLIKLQYPASQYADDAQYYLAEISYERGDFILSAMYYNMLRRIYPQSPYCKISLYKSGLSYFELSPSYDRDQEYTLKAIRTFSEYQILYPDDSLKNEAGKKIIELRDKLSERELFTAELYRKLFNPTAAVVYYDFVISDYNDTHFLEQAIVGKIECLAEMKKRDEALSIIELYKKSYPNGKLNDRVLIAEKIINKIKK